MTNVVEYYNENGAHNFHLDDGRIISISVEESQIVLNLLNGDNNRDSIVIWYDSYDKRRYGYTGNLETLIGLAHLIHETLRENDEATLLNALTGFDKLENYPRLNPKPLKTGSGN